MGIFSEADKLSRRNADLDRRIAEKAAVERHRKPSAWLLELAAGLSARRIPLVTPYELVRRVAPATQLQTYDIAWQAGPELPGMRRGSVECDEVDARAYDPCWLLKATTYHIDGDQEHAFTLSPDGWMGYRPGMEFPRMLLQARTRHGGLLYCAEQTSRCLIVHGLPQPLPEFYRLGRGVNVTRQPGRMDRPIVEDEERSEHLGVSIARALLENRGPRPAGPIVGVSVREPTLTYEDYWGVRKDD